VSPIELILSAVVKNIDFETLLKSPRVAELVDAMRQIAADFRAIKEQNSQILAMLEKYEYSKNASLFDD
jgi:hypothetical protein